MLGLDQLDQQPVLSSIAPTKWLVPVVITGLAFQLLGLGDLLITPLILFLIPFMLSLK